MRPHRPKAFAACLVLSAAACLIFSLRPTSAGLQSTAIRRLTLTAEHATSLNPALGGDGRRVVFESTANLSGVDGAAQFRAFAADVSGDLTTFSRLAASRAPAAAVSQDGSRVAFASAEDLTGANPDRNSEIFLHDGGTLRQITNTSPGDPSARPRDGSFQPSISDDGRLIAFASNRDLAAGSNADGNSEIFLFDSHSNAFAQLTDTSGTPGATAAKLSGDGSRIAFLKINSIPPTETDNSRRAAGDAAPHLQLVLRERATGASRVVFEAASGLALSPGRSISDDGLRVVFSAEDAKGASQVFLFDGRNDAVRQLTQLGARQTDVPLHPSISGDGSRVSFATRRGGVAGTNTDASVELYLYDLPTNRFERVTNAPREATAEVVSSLDDTGSLVAFNFSRALAESAGAGEFSDTSEIFLASLPPRAPFSNDLQLLHGATLGRDPSPDKALAPGQIAIARGSNFSLVSRQSRRPPAGGDFPAAFAGVNVTVNGRPSRIFFVSPTQINFQVPDETETGAAEFVVRNHDGYESRATARIVSAAPGLFTERGDGAGAAVALDADTHLRAPFDPADASNNPRRIVLFATGVARARSLTVSIAGRDAHVEAVVASGDLPGLDEVHVRLRHSLAGAGVVPCLLTADGRAGNTASLQFVGARRPARITLTPAAASLGVGRSVRLAAKVLDAEGAEIADAPVSFESSDEAVASVDAGGIARGVGPGSAAIRATSGDASATSQLHVHTLTLVVNEVLADPPDGAAGDANRDGLRNASQDEFVEIVNASAADLDLGGHRIAVRGSSGSDTARHTFAVGTVLAPGAAAVVFGGAEGATFDPRDPAFGGAHVSTASTGGLSLTNGAGTVTLLSPAGSVIEQMTYGGATDLDGDRNQSLTRAPDVTGDFSPHLLASAIAGRAFSPGTKVDAAPFDTTSPISRIEIAPASATIQTGTHQNFQARAFDGAGREMGGLIFRWESRDVAVASVDQNGLATAHAAGATEIVARARGVQSPPAALTVTPPPRRISRVEVTPPAVAINRGGALQLAARAFDQNDLLVSDASFAWSSGGSAVAAVDGAGRARGVGAGVVTITASTGDGAGGTVSADATLEVRVPLVLNELLADVPPDDAATAAVEGDSNRDGARRSDDDEFIELVNASDAPVDLSGVRIADSTGVRFTFPAGAVLAGRGAAVVFGGGTPRAGDPAFGGALLFAANALSLNDAGDAVTLKLPVGGVDFAILTQSYGAAGGPHAPSDQSLTRAHDAARDDDASNFAPHLAAPDAAGRAFSPGTRADGTPFGSQPLARVEVSPSSATLDIGAARTFTARAFTNAGASAVEVENVSFAWDVDDAGAASLSHAAGPFTNLTARAAGQVTLRARAGGRQATVTITISPPPPVLTSVELTPRSATFAAGESRRFTARALDQYAQPFPVRSFNFTSSTEAAAAVESISFTPGASEATATVAGRGVGASQLTATAGDDTRTAVSVPAALTITEPPRRVARVEIVSSAARLNRGGTLRLNARAFDQNNSEVPGAIFAWASSDAAIAAVDAAGVVRGAGVGRVGVSASTPDGAGGRVESQVTLDVSVPLVLNELLADVPPDDAATAAVEGDANRDGIRNSGDDEFVELFNDSAEAVDLSGLRVFDSTAARFTFPAGSVLGAGRAAVVFGGGSPPTADPAFGGALVFRAASLGLNDGGDTLTLKLAVGANDVVVLTQAYGATSTPPAPGNESLTRSPDAGGESAAGTFVSHSAATHAAGRAFSPGTRADGTPFGAPPVARIEITPASAAVEIGAAQNFTARSFGGAPGAEFEIRNVSYVWDASDPSKASVAPAAGQSAMVTARADGRSGVRARAGGREAAATMIINPPPPVLTRVELTPQTQSLVVGQTGQLTAHALDQHGQPFPVESITFAPAGTDDAAAAAVGVVSFAPGTASAAAAVSARRAGTAQFKATARAGARSVESLPATITVNDPPPAVTSITVSPGEAAIGVGATQRFTARAFDQNGRELSAVAFNWTSGDAATAAISDGGVATGASAGTTQIRASASGVTSDPATLRVTPPPVPAAGQVIINEALVAFSTSPTQQRADFVELHNTTDQALDISGLAVSFRAGGSGNNVRTITLPGAPGSDTLRIGPRSYFLIVNGAQTFGASLQSAGGRPDGFDASRAATDINPTTGAAAPSACAATSTCFDLNNTTGAIRIEIGGVKLDGLTYKGGADPVPHFLAFGEGALFAFASGTTNDLIRTPNASDVNNNSADFKRNGTAASVTPGAGNP